MLRRMQRDEKRQKIGEMRAFWRNSWYMMSGWFEGWWRKLRCMGANRGF